MADYPIITDVTYAELVAMIGGSTLEPGCSYLITDFATVHWMVDSDGDYILTDDSEPEKIINTGATEPLLVTATSTNTIAKEVHSATYPDDIIHYEHDIASLNTLKQFYDSDLTETVTGFKGAITWRNDTNNNLQMSWDWRNIKHRLWNIKQPAWEAKAYAQNDCVTDDLMIYWAKLAVADVAEVYTVTLACPDNPAPGNITIVPNAVGTNPVTYYYKMCYMAEGTLRSEFSAEGSYIQGNSTTSILLNCDALPAWADCFALFLGVTTGVYTYYISSDDVSDFDIFDLMEEENGMLVAVTAYPTTFGTANITGIGGLTKLVTFNDDLATTAEDFVTAFAEDYAESGVGVLLTQGTGENNADLIFTSDTAGVSIDAPVITNVTGNLTGTVVHTTANYSVETEPKDDTSGRWINLQITADQYICYTQSGYGYMPLMDLDDYVDTSPFGESCVNIVLEQNKWFDYMTFGSSCGNMTFGSNCYNMTFGSGCYSMTFGSNCSSMTFGSSCERMTFGSGCNTITFGSGCYTMTFGSDCDGMTFGSGCYTMTFGSSCDNLTFGSNCYYMTFGSYCYYMTFESSCYAMTFGSNCNTMTFGSSCFYMTFGSYCYYMTFGSSCFYMTFGSGCSSMSFGSGCSSMSFGSSCNAMTFGSNCSSMTFGSSCYTMTFGSGCYAMTFGSGCYTMTFPEWTAFNDFKDRVNGVDFTGVGITQITTGITVTHQRANNGSAETVQSYLNWDTDHYEMVYSTNKIGVYQD